jgi:hypothetical protein
MRAVAVRRSSLYDAIASRAKKYGSGRISVVQDVVAKSFKDLGLYGAITAVGGGRREVARLCSYGRGGDLIRALPWVADSRTSIGKAVVFVLIELVRKPQGSIIQR